MEQIVRNMLRQQGIEIVGVFDKEKDIWIYIKDEKVFFCKGDLSHVDRKKLGLNQEVLALTKSNDSVRVISDEEYFTNFIVIDKNNKIISHSQNNNKCILKRMQPDSFVIVDGFSWERCNRTYHKPSIQLVHQSGMVSFTFIDGEYLESYHLRSIFGNIFFFSVEKGYWESNECAMFDVKQGFIYEGKKWPHIWMHENGDAQIFVLENDSDLGCKRDEADLPCKNRTLSGTIKMWTLDKYNSIHVFRSADYIIPNDMQADNTELDEYFLENTLFSNNYVLFPFVEGYGAFVIHYENIDLVSISAYTILFKCSYPYDGTYSFPHNSSRICKYEYTFTGYILKIEEAIEDCDDFDEEGEPICHTNHYYHFYDIYGNRLDVKDDNFKRNYLVFTSSNKGGGLEKFKNVHGVMNKWDNEIIVPPIYNNIIVIDDEKGLFEITYLNLVKGKYHQTKGLYSVPDGFIIPFGLEYSIEDMIDYAPSPDKVIKKYVVYSNGNKKGIICNGEKLFNAEYDYISEGCYFNNHSFFVAGKQGKECIISDDSNFDKYRNVEYDNITISHTIINKECFFIVEKEEKFGAICTSEKYNIPIIFDYISKIVNSGVICNKVLYDRNGKELFVLGDKYKHIKTKFFDVFKAIGSNVFIFINSQGEQLNAKNDEYDDNILHVEGAFEAFNIEKEDFVEEEEDYYYDYDDGYTQKELDDMYRAAYEGDPEAQWNTD